MNSQAVVEDETVPTPAAVETQVEIVCESPASTSASVSGISIDSRSNIV